VNLEDHRAFVKEPVVVASGIQDFDGCPVRLPMPEPGGLVVRVVERHIARADGCKSPLHQVVVIGGDDEEITVFRTTAFRLCGRQRRQELVHLGGRKLPCEQGAKLLVELSRSLGQVSILRDASQVEFRLRAQALIGRRLAHFGRLLIVEVAGKLSRQLPAARQVFLFRPLPLEVFGTIAEVDAGAKKRHDTALQQLADHKPGMALGQCGVDRVRHGQ